ncbi:CLUMA_CG008935, isoform A [Clunio marinus]|uniref:CLUMA_CG008935, isoform A n=1 Tax=Clunio marinus TaxID=568069 RepID=A0A1J1I6U6_9DIPT|nr:CLUMA_CG008935, isoform A [Clunio marinus]
MPKKREENLANKFTLFIRLSRRIPNVININDAVREMYPSVANVRKPRQKSARWFLVDFETNEQAEEYKKILLEKKEIAKIKVKINKLTIRENNSLSKSDNERQQFVNNLTKQTFQIKCLEKYSNKLLVSELPENVTKADIAELFPHHTNLDLKHSPKLRAIITYSSSKEAMAARMNVRPIIDGKKIRVILLLLQNDSERKRKDSDISVDLESPEKLKKSSDNKRKKSLRYFE